MTDDIIRKLGKLDDREAADDPDEVLAVHAGANLHITRESLDCLEPEECLNDDEAEESDDDEAEESDDDEAEEGDAGNEEAGEGDPGTRPLETQEMKEYEAAELGPHSDGTWHPDPEQVLAMNEGHNLKMTWQNLQCLCPRVPLPEKLVNDEVMNFYMATLNDRDARDHEGPRRLPRVHFFNTFFYAKLRSLGCEDPKVHPKTVHKGVKTWSLPDRLVFKGKDIHGRCGVGRCDRVIFPIHSPESMHWFCVMLDITAERIVCMDSRWTVDENSGEKIVDDSVPKVLAQWYKLDRLEKKNEDLHTEKWPIEYWDCPQQRNGYDCGVFVAKYCECLGRGADFSFSQDDMDTLRKRLVVEICRNYAPDITPE